jgi:hypothetical protein
MDTYAVINSANVVINVIIWNGMPPWTPPEGCIAVQIPEGSFAGIDWTYVDDEFIAPPGIE